MGGLRGPTNSLTDHLDHHFTRSRNSRSNLSASPSAVYGGSGPAGSLRFAFIPASPVAFSSFDPVTCHPPNKISWDVRRPDAVPPGLEPRGVVGGVCGYGECRWTRSYPGRAGQGNTGGRFSDA
jgi:hypothetical protein